MNLTIDKDLLIEVVRTKRRKTASIKIIDGAVQVIVPEQLSDIRVQELMQKRTTWIRKKLHEQSQIVPPKPREYVDDEAFTYLGRNYRLKISQKTNCEVKLKGGYLEVGLPNSSNKKYIRNALVEWYEVHALARLTEKTNRYAETMGLAPNSIYVRDYKSRWGSCSSNGQISYNWRIIIAPHRIVDYVVVHELLHLEHPNHSPAYWRSVKRAFPDYALCRQWLRTNTNKLMV